MSSVSEKPGEAKPAAAGASPERELARLEPDEAKQLYDQVCSSIRATDEISFKLLSLVPLVSGGGITILLSTSTSLARLPLVVFVGLFGAVVTFALFRWELRNIQTCSRLIGLGAALERERLGLQSAGQFSGRRPPPTFLGREIGKTEAERVVYSAVIVAWLLLPVVAALLVALED